MSRRIAKPVAIISSTLRYLPEHLREALDVCLQSGVVPTMLEPVLDGDPALLQKALTLIDVADVYIGFFGRENENMPPAHHRALGEMEYERAAQRGIPRLIFITSKEADEQSAGLIGWIKERQSVIEAESPKKFRALLSESLARLGVRDAKSKGGADGKAKGPLKNKQRRLLRVFVASPGDVQDERSRMPKIIGSLNRTLGTLLNVTLELWRWETDAIPSAGEPQALIDPELVQADIVIVIFWNRLGTPTLAGVTGTQAEVIRTLEQWRVKRHPHLMIYFCQRPARLESAQLKQRIKLLEFRQRLTSVALIIDYEDVHEFEWRVHDDLFITITRLYLNSKPGL